VVLSSGLECEGQGFDPQHLQATFDLNLHLVKIHKANFKNLKKLNLSVVKKHNYLTLILIEKVFDETNLELSAKQGTL